MPLVKVKEKYQVTIPSTIRKKLPLKVGDILEVSLKHNEIVLKPQVVLDRAEALEKLFTVLSQGRTPQRIPDKEVIEDALETIREIRRLKHAKSRA